MGGTGPPRNQSHPVRVRGLKLERLAAIETMNKVAPRAGAWIETGIATYVNV